MRRSGSSSVGRGYAWGSSIQAAAVGWSGAPPRPPQALLS